MRININKVDRLHVTLLQSISVEDLSPKGTLTLVRQIVKLYRKAKGILDEEKLQDWELIYELSIDLLNRCLSQIEMFLGDPEASDERFQVGALDQLSTIKGILYEVETTRKEEQDLSENYKALAKLGLV